MNDPMPDDDFANVSSPISRKSPRDRNYHLETMLQNVGWSFA